MPDSGTVVDRVGLCCEEPQRLASLYRYAILDTETEPVFDEITRLASEICQTPIALISFIDRTRQWFKSEIGLGVKQTPLNISICAHALVQQDLLVVPDTTLDDRFRNNPIVAGKPEIRFYAGALLHAHDGHPLGTLCVLDYQPRNLTQQQLDSLRILSRLVMTQLELRRTLDDQRIALAEQTRLRENLSAALQAANKAGMAKDHFLATLSHELRTPLSPALMLAASMATDPNLPQSVREDAQLIERNILLETRMIDDLLDINRVVTGKLSLALETTDVHALLHDSTAMCGADARAKNIPVQLDLSAARSHIRGDAAKLQQVFCNLLANAIKFTPPQGAITISTSNNAAGQLVIRFTDTGMGIPSEILPDLFQPFQQGGDEVTRKFGGLGLGLALCKGIIEAHGGAIAAGSDGPGRGSVITIELNSVSQPNPVASTPADPKSLTASQSPVQSHGRPKLHMPNPQMPKPQLQILLVDDHHDTLHAMSRLLAKLQHKVITADCVSAALKAAGENNFDILISDVGLPDGTGLELMETLLNQRPIRGIALTGYGAEADIERTQRAGFAAHLTKPINFQDLENAIRQVSI